MIAAASRPEPVTAAEAASRRVGSRGPVRKLDEPGVAK